MAQEDSEELIWAKNELKGTLATLEADLEDLDESVKIVESTGARLFGLDDMEVMKRRQYVSHVRREIENMRVEVSGEAPHSQRHSASPPARAPARDDEQSEWAREEQQVRRP
jgi:activator of HSP90 ATPase